MATVDGERERESWEIKFKARQGYWPQLRARLGEGKMDSLMRKTSLIIN